MASLSPNFLDELRARTPIAALIGRSVRLTRSGREHKGCCPFHGEKTPSFYVYDDHFHCFGCGEHGDAITFVMKSTNAAFMEAVETLASEAGLDVPKASPQAAEAEKQRASLTEILQTATQTYRKWLFEPQGVAALNYLRGRGLTEATIEKFGLGWSGEGRGQLANALRGQGITAEQLIEAGLMKAGDNGPVDMFFSRIMFPISDRRGNKISFGGRVLGDAQPKYVNGPETPVFSKRRTLYGLNFAREAVRKGDALIVVEGYMDVIALAQAGFGGAVAPLGTALTEDHLTDIWKLSPEPVICFDADAAGRRAALRTVDLALAALAPDRGLKFLRLPEKDDPDSIIKREGASAFKTRLEAAPPLSILLFDMLAEGAVRNTPEGRASFYKRLHEVAGRVPDKALASEYRDLLMKRFFAERRGTRGHTGKSGQNKPLEGLARPKLEMGLADSTRGIIMTATLIAYPQLFPEVEEAFARISLPSSCERLRYGLNRFVETGLTLDSETLLTHFEGLGLAEEARLVLAVATGHYRHAPDASQADVAKSWWSWDPLMSSSIQMLRQQRDEQQAFWQASHNLPQERDAWLKLVKYNELLQRALSGEYGADP